MSKRQILVTSALPYANGSIHLGHLVEYIQTDIWARYQKLKGNHCVYICADDTHGTPIMLSAQKQGISPEELIAKVHHEHLSDFKAFHIEFDHYGSTNCEANRHYSEEIYKLAKEKGLISIREIDQLYDPKAEMFLPDRFVKGSCPKCQAEDQYGDSCEHCSATYSPMDLENPISAVSGETPIIKQSEHHFFTLSRCEAALKQWIKGEQLRPELQNKLQEWFEDGLKDWDISRDAPYFGFKIPGTEDKYFYVWLDAPVGYIAATQEYCDQHGLDITEFWKSEHTEIHHFIGKDILYFHALFWPAMLMTAEYSLPKKINVHGFLTVNGEKMSKSRGTFILAQTYLEHLDPEYLRYYYAAKLTGAVDDIDLNLEDFVLKVNADVVNKLVNIGSRVGSILKKRLDNTLSEPDQDGQALLDQITAAIPSIDAHYEAVNFHKAMKEIMAQADAANKYINDSEPWNLVKEDPEAARKICSSAINALKILSGLLKPVLPVLTEKVEDFLQIPAQNWDSIPSLITDHQIRDYEHLAQRLDLEQVNKIIN